MPTDACPNHPDADAEHLFDARDPVTGDRFTVVRCATCGLARTDPRLSAQELDRYYPDGYHGAAKRYRFGLDRTVAALYRARIARIERLAGGRGRVLDIGCGPGWFLEEMRRRGWAVTGTERSDNAARQARERLGLDVRVAEPAELVADGELFDAVVLWHVAEHLPDPARTFGDVAALLRPGGVAMIAVPNFGSVEAAVGGSGWFHLDVPRHLFHFTRAALLDALRAAGLTPAAEVFTAPEYDVFSIVQTVENRLGLPQNLLYDLVRRREARLTHPGVRLTLSIAAVVLAVPLAAIGAVLAPLAAALGRAGTVTIYARRDAA